MTTTRRMFRVSQPDKQNGTLSADTIRASGLVRPHQQAGHKTAPDQNAKNIESTLAMREPSTQDVPQTSPIWRDWTLSDSRRDPVQCGRVSMMANERRDMGSDSERHS